MNHSFTTVNLMATGQGITTNMLISVVLLSLLLYVNKVTRCHSHAEKGAKVSKRTGSISLGYWLDSVPLEVHEKHIYFDIDLYENETVSVGCPYLTEDSYLDPLDEMMFYHTNAFQSAASTDDDGSYPKHRLKRKISDVVEMLDVTKIDGTPEWQFSFVGEPYNYGIERLYFDCIDNSGGKRVHTASVQINVMPTYHTIKAEENLDFTTTKYSPDGIYAVYVKYPRPGTSLSVTCHDFALSGNYGMDHRQSSITMEGVSEVGVTIVMDFAQDFECSASSHEGSEVCRNRGKYLLYLICEILHSNTMVDAGSLAKNMDETSEQSINPENHMIHFYHPENAKDIEPPDFPEALILNSNTPTRVKDFAFNVNATRKAEKYSAIDVSLYYTYRSHAASFIVKQSAGTYSMKYNIKFVAVCDFTNIDYLDADGKTCTVFVSSDESVTVRGARKDDPHIDVLPWNDPTMILEKITEPENKWDSNIFKMTKPPKAQLVKVATAPSHTGDGGFLFSFTSISHNPRYYVWLKGDFVDGMQYDKIIRVYMADVSLHGKTDGSQDIRSEHLIDGNVPEKGKFISFVRRGTNVLYIRCNKLFKDPGKTEFVLYPEGKNTFFANVEDTVKDPHDIPISQFQEEFATYGVSIYKSPEAKDGIDLEFVFDTDNAIWATYKRPIYFICARKDYDLKKHSYAVVAVDPFFQHRRLYGCGTKPEIFLNNEGKRNTETRCSFTLDGKRTVGFFCPSPVPEHFLSGNQSQWAPSKAKSNVNSNPYHIMIRCYDRSKRFQKIFKPKVDINFFEKLASVGELRSLWIFSRGQFIREGRKPLSLVLCSCYNTEGKNTASIYISPGFRKKFA
ncbi:uncharacterized protein BXIN_2042 [Babesia sp. Xinjiang]|uniref:uncharacterized protein n=1 Tax=Babesia sp. Xinjiang TaxID=462227 RepID=UPI000A2653C3|nr:uncharacterized protein BXIN_2042 [Babesia sp. Xinjiang]ORM40539.1 hypothetical protein BXIN_2042 [Babesia sp. Xinjiang]